MGRPPDDVCDGELWFYSEHWKLERLESRSAISPEELLSGLEDLLARGEITDDQLIHYYQQGILP